MASAPFSPFMDPIDPIEPSSSAVSTPLIIGIVVSACCIVGIVITFFVVRHARRKRRAKHEKRTPRKLVKRKRSLEFLQNPPPFSPQQGSFAPFPHSPGYAMDPEFGAHRSRLPLSARPPSIMSGISDFIPFLPLVFPSSPLSPRPRRAFLPPDMRSLDVQSQAPSPVPTHNSRFQEDVSEIFYVPPALPISSVRPPSLPRTPIRSTERADYDPPPPSSPRYSIHSIPSSPSFGSSERDNDSDSLDHDNMIRISQYGRPERQPRPGSLGLAPPDSEASRIAREYSMRTANVTHNRDQHSPSALQFVDRSGPLPTLTEVPSPTSSTAAASSTQGSRSLPPIPTWSVTIASPPMAARIEDMQTIPSIPSTPIMRNRSDDAESFFEG